MICILCSIRAFYDNVRLAFWCSDLVVGRYVVTDDSCFSTELTLGYVESCGDSAGDRRVSNLERVIDVHE